MASVFVSARAGALRKARTDAGASLRDLAAASGVSRSTIAAVERDPDNGLEVGKARALARALGIAPGSIFRHKNGDPVAWDAA